MMIFLTCDCEFSGRTSITTLGTLCYFFMTKIKFYVNTIFLIKRQTLYVLNFELDSKTLQQSATIPKQSNFQHVVWQMDEWSDQIGVAKTISDSLETCTRNILLKNKIPAKRDIRKNTKL